MVPLYPQVSVQLIRPIHRSSGGKGSPEPGRTDGGWFEKKALLEEMLEGQDPVRREISELKYFRKHHWWMVAGC